MPSNHLILCRPLPLLPSIFPSITVFSNESVLRVRCPSHWKDSFNISPSNKYSGLVSFRMDWLDQISLQSKGLSRVFSNTTAQKHPFFGARVLTKYLASALLFSLSLEGRLARLSFFSSDPRRSPSFTPLCRAVRRKLRVPGRGGGVCRDASRPGAPGLRVLLVYMWGHSLLCCSERPYTRACGVDKPSLTTDNFA